MVSVHASVTPDYPFSHYEVSLDTLGAREDTVSELVCDYVRGRLSAQQLCRDAGFGDAHDSFDAFKQTLDANRLGFPQTTDAVENFTTRLSKLLHAFVGQSASDIAEHVQRRLFGYALVQPLFDDPDIEEIVINGIKRPVIVQHKVNGTCTTNVMFETDKQLRAFITQMGSQGDKAIEDIRLADGSRGNIVMPPTCSAPAITIRKFR
ncbi:MAG: hypothetical protein Q7R41_02230, partial [Phycisphaerales bacterium]|nr:hypothetical protein [Phycisphaerales bacterium]